MPHVDPEKRKAYQREWRRARRAQEKLGELANGRRKVGRRRQTQGGGPSPGSAVGLSLAAAGELLDGGALDFEQWTRAKAEIGAEMIARARAHLAAVDPADMTTTEAVKLMAEGARLVDAALLQSGAETTETGPRLRVEALGPEAIDLVHRLLDLTNP